MMTLTPHSVLRFLPAALAVVGGGVSAAFVRAHQLDYPGAVIMIQIVMFAAALLAASSRRWVWSVGFLLLSAGVVVVGTSIGIFYAPALFAALWARMRDQERNETGVR